MQWPRVRFTVRWMMIAVLALCLLFGGMSATRRSLESHDFDRERLLIQVAAGVLAVVAALEYRGWSRAAKYRRQLAKALALAEVMRREEDSCSADGFDQESTEADQLALLREEFAFSAARPWLDGPVPPEPR